MTYLESALFPGSVLPKNIRITGAQAVELAEKIKNLCRAPVSKNASATNGTFG